jgi:hypothetical protein
MNIIKYALITGILWVGFATNGGSFGLPHFGPDSAFAAKGGNGNGNSGGSRSGKSNGNRDKQDTAKADKADKTNNQNLSAELKGLNSLNRNINGLINSSDPKMDGFRTLVTTGDELTPEQFDAAIDAAIETALGEEPESGWSVDLVDWVEERVTELSTDYDKIDEGQTTIPD